MATKKKTEKKDSVRDRLIGKHVVVRSSSSGVWLGVLKARDDTTAYLCDARRAWDWQGAASCSGLAVRGPSGGQICEPVDFAIVADCCEFLAVTQAAIARWLAVVPWVA